MKNEIEFKFGDYAIIEQKRHGVPNEMFVHKVVGQLRSNTWVDVPVRVPATETLHGEMEDICLCICCGIDETEVRRYRVKDMRRHSPVSLVADEKRGSTITLQAVNELIQSLESAGELSIKERKYLELAREFKRLAAENVGLKAGASYFSYGSEHNFEWHKTAKEAVEAAEAAIDDYRGDACDGWSEEVDSICWGIIMQSSTMVGERPRTEEDRCDSAIDTICDYALLPAIDTPATDRILAAAEARGVEKFAAEQRGVAERLKKRGGDVVMSSIKFCLESAEEAEVFAQQLREGADK
ncbi:TPA: hypothetical protein ACKE1B_003207 [Klebsiella michiganensis]